MKQKRFRVKPPCVLNLLLCMLNFLPRRVILPFCTCYLHTNFHVFISWDFFSTVMRPSYEQAQRKEAGYVQLPRQILTYIIRRPFSASWLSTATLCFSRFHSFLLTRISQYDPIYYDVLPVPTCLISLFSDPGLYDLNSVQSTSSHSPGILPVNKFRYRLCRQLPFEN